MAPFIYKICHASEWAAAESSGKYLGSDADLRDSFIHFSTAAQIAQTAAKHFAGCDDLVVVTIATEVLGEALKWEPSRGGDLFPHLYGVLATSLVSSVRPLARGGDGQHIIPEDLK